MSNFTVGARVELKSAAGAPGTIVELRRGKLLVEFDDQLGVKWLLRPASLQVLEETKS